MFGRETGLRLFRDQAVACGIYKILVFLFSEMPRRLVVPIIGQGMFCDLIGFIPVHCRNVPHIYVERERVELGFLSSPCLFVNSILKSIKLDSNN